VYLFVHKKNKQKQLAQHQKKYIRKKIFKYGDQDEDEEEECEENYCDISSFSHYRSDEKNAFR